MKKFIMVMFVVALTGCATTEPSIRVVPADKPAPFCPAPPAVPSIAYKVDGLTVDDAKDPGKVSMAYKYDMAYLRAVVRIYQRILDEYAKTSQNFDEVKAEIDKAYLGIQPVVPAVAPTPTKPTTP